jgi:hypothetical protein
MEAHFDFRVVFEPEDYLYLYRDALTKDRTGKELEFLVEKLELKSPIKILDLACGYGRHSLAKLGHQITGVDVTQGFLDIDQKRCKREGNR